MRKLFFLAVLAICQVASAQIAITVPDEPIEVNRHYLLKVTGLESADLPSTQLIVEPKTASAVGVSGWAGEQYVWFSGIEKGRHFVAVIVVRGGKPIVASTTIEVGGSNPNPDPLPPPPEEDLWGAVIIEETGVRTAEFASILVSPKLSTYKKTAGVEVLAVDQDVTDESGKVLENLLPYLKSAEGKELPMMFIMGKQGFEFYSGPVPGTVDETIALLKKYAKKER